MKADLRETLGKAAYDALTAVKGQEVGSYQPVWENIGETAREAYRIEAEGVVLALAELMIPQLQHVAMVLTDRPIEITLGELTAL